MDDLSEKSGPQLKELLSRLQVDLEDIEEERAFVLGQTGLHVSASVVAKYESERNALRTKIEEVQQTLATRGADER